MAEHTIYTTFEPNRKRVVSENEYTDLQRQGLIKDEQTSKKRQQTGSTSGSGETREQ